MLSHTALVEKRLSEIFGQKNLVKIQNALQESNAVISGSFIIQCILGEYWEGSDIDIYVPVPENIPTVIPKDAKICSDLNSSQILRSELTNGSKYSEGGYLITEIENVLFDISDNSVHNGCYQQEGASKGRYCGLFGESIYGMREYYIRQNDMKKQKIQVMQVNIKKMSLFEFIFDSFDFDFCKAYYGVRGNQSFLNCFNLNSILSKSSKFNHTVDLKTTLERFQKYSQRGFEFTYHDKSIKNVYLDVGIKKVMDEL